MVRRSTTKTQLLQTITFIILMIPILISCGIAEDEIILYGYNQYPLNIRQEMSIESEWIAQYPSRSTIKILEDCGEWYRVELGYVKKEFVYEEIEIYECGKLLEDALIYSSPNSNTQATAIISKDSEVMFVKKENGFLELELGGFVSEYAVSFSFERESSINPNTITIEELERWNMPDLPIQYLGTLAKRTAGKGVTVSGSLYFKDVIPIYDIIDGEAYFPSGRNIYKLSIDKFSKIENVGAPYEILAAYRTIYYTSNYNRKHNIALVSTFLDGTIIKAGKTFSYNKTTGPRSQEKGYLEAAVIENGEYVPGFGGGVCQVSSTIYAAILNQGNFEVTHRKPHGLEVSYLPYGMDATVSYGSIDLKFINNNPFDVILNVKSEDGVCLVTITRAE